MTKTHSTVNIDVDLKDLALAKKINLSKTLNDSLIAILNLEGNEKILEEKENMLKLELKAVQNKKKKLVKESMLEEAQKDLLVMEQEVNEIKALKYQEVVTPSGHRALQKIENEQFNISLKAFCEKWNVDLKTASDWANGLTKIQVKGVKK